MKLRPEVQWFAEQMELALEANDHKGGWGNDSSSALLTRLREETEELKTTLNKGHRLSPSHAVKEAADVANFAMMIADNAKNLRQPMWRVMHPTHST